MMEELTAEEIEDWRAYFEARPFGEAAQDARFAMLMALVASLASGKRAKPEDFLLAKPPKRPPRFEQVAQALRLAAGMGAGSKRHGHGTG